MSFYYMTDENHELDEATFWEYVRFKTNEIYGNIGMHGIKPLYSKGYWGDCCVSVDILKLIINNELIKILEDES